MAGAVSSHARAGDVAVKRLGDLRRRDVIYHCEMADTEAL